METRKVCVYIQRLFAATLLLAISACASQSVKMIQPQTGATAECRGSGIGTSFSEGFVSGCTRAYENRGFVRLEQLTPEQRASLEQRGLMPKDK